MGESWSLPANSFAEHTERSLADNLVRDRAVRRMETAAAHVAIEPLELVLPEHPGPARDVHHEIDDALGSFDSAMLHRDELDRAAYTIVHTLPPLAPER